MGTLFSNSKYPVHQFKKMFICFNQTAFNFVNNCSDVLGKGVQTSKQLFLYVPFNSKKDRLMVKIENNNKARRTTRLPEKLNLGEDAPNLSLNHA